MDKKHLIIFSTLFISSFLVGITLGAIVTNQQHISKSPFMDITMQAPASDGKTYMPVSPIFKNKSAEQKLFNW